MGSGVVEETKNIMEYSDFVDYTPKVTSLNILSSNNTSGHNSELKKHKRSLTRNKSSKNNSSQSSKRVVSPREKKRGQDKKSPRIRLSTTDEKDSGKRHQSHRHTHRKHRNRDFQQS